MSELVFVPGAGFRPASAHTLVTPVIETRGEWTVTVERLIATPDSTELGFTVNGPMAGSGDPGDAPYAMNDPVRLGEPDGRVLELLPGRRGPIAWSGSAHSSARTIRRSLFFDALTAGTTHVDVLLGGATGDWTVPVDLTPATVHGLPAQRIDSEDTHHGVRIAATAVARAGSMTAVEVHTSFAPTPLPRHMRSLGTKTRMRGDDPQFTLTDDAGSQLVEFASFQDAVTRGSDLHEVLVFPPLAASATAAMLTIPHVRVAEYTGSPVTLPIPSDADIQLGQYAVHARVSRDRGFKGEAVRVELDDGGWHDDRRLVYAESVRVDGVDRGVGFKNLLELPMPVEAEDPSGSGREVTLESPVVQLRGPWSLRIAL